MNERSLFLAALERPEPAERQRYLDEQCGGDSALRQRVAELLAAHARSADFLAAPAVGQAPPAAPDDATATHSPGSGDPRAEIADLLAPSDHPGSLGRLGHYEVLEVVGRGGMGIVLRAFDAKLHRVVALKLMARELAGSPTARKRFIREAKAAAAVSHDNVVAIYAVEDQGPLPFLVMQFVAGTSLDRKLKCEGSLELKEILRIGLQIASGLAAAHKQGLVHRDIKPANILLENGVQRVKITDFGLARAVDDASVTQSGTIAGTPQYMSPEQADGQPVDHRSDLFSLGSVLYAMCTGRAPFRADSTMATLRRVCDDTPRPIRELNPDMPEWLGEIIERLHAKQPAGRFNTAMEVEMALVLRLAEVQGVSSTGPIVPTTVSALSPPPAMASTEAALTPGWLVSLVQWALALLAIGGLVQLVVVIFLFSRGSLMIWALAAVGGGVGLLLLALVFNWLRRWFWPIDESPPAATPATAPPPPGRVPLTRVWTAIASTITATSLFFIGTLVAAFLERKVAEQVIWSALFALFGLCVAVVCLQASRVRNLPVGGARSYRRLSLLFAALGVGLIVAGFVATQVVVPWFYFELRVKLPDEFTRVELWRMDENDYGIRKPRRLVRTFDERGTISTRLAPGMYLLICFRHGDVYNQQQVTADWSGRKKIEIAPGPGDIDGKWILHSAEYQVARVPPEQLAKQFPTEMVLMGQQYSLTWDGKLHEGKFELNGGNLPAEIDFTGSVFAGLRPRKAIYQLKGDELTLCLSFVAKGDPPRPTRFTTGPDSKNAVLTYRRATGP